MTYHKRSWNAKKNRSTQRRVSRERLREAGAKEAARRHAENVQKAKASA